MPHVRVSRNVTALPYGWESSLGQSFWRTHQLETSIEMLNIHRNSITSPISKNLAYRHGQSHMKYVCTRCLLYHRNGKNWKESKHPSTVKWIIGVYSHNGMLHSNENE